MMCIAENVSEYTLKYLKTWLEKMYNYPFFMCLHLHACAHSIN